MLMFYWGCLTSLVSRGSIGWNGGCRKEGEAARKLREQKKMSWRKGKTFAPNVLKQFFWTKLRQNMLQCLLDGNNILSFINFCSFLLCLSPSLTVFLYIALIFFLSMFSARTLVFISLYIYRGSFWSFSIFSKFLFLGFGPILDFSPKFPNANNSVVDPNSAILPNFSRKLGRKWKWFSLIPAIQYQSLQAFSHLDLMLSDQDAQKSGKVAVILFRRKVACNGTLRRHVRKRLISTTFCLNS